MPWPNLTPQELAQYQMLAQGQPQAIMGQAMTPQMNPYMMQQNPGMQMQPMMGNQANAMAGNALTNPTMAALLRQQGQPGQQQPFNLSSIMNNPALMQYWMQMHGMGGPAAP